MPISSTHSQSLERFLNAQQDIYETALVELRAGYKRNHWMWFIFPQLQGLGHSAMARYYAIGTLTEARRYLTHPLLGARLRECAQVLLAVEGRTAHEIFGYPDELKLRSSLTLFSVVAAEVSIFDEVLEKYFGGERDTVTLSLLAEMEER